MARLDKEMDLKLRKQKLQAKKVYGLGAMGYVQEKLDDIANVVSVRVLSPLRNYLYNKKQNKSLQVESQQQFNEYLSLHDDSKIGSVQKFRLKDGGLKIIVYTKEGPIIKTIQNSDVTSMDEVPDKHIDSDFYHSRPSRIVTYEGYCSWYDYDLNDDHFYYAKVSHGVKENFGDNGKYTEDRYSGFERNDEGKFKKIDLVVSEFNPVEVYTDLMQRFEEYYRLYNHISEEMNID